MPKLINLSGQRFGRLLVLRRNGFSASRTPMWECECDCGKRFTAQGGNIRTGATQTCGCGVARAAKERMTTHGRSKSAEYKIWAAMRKRCNNPSAIYFRNYGGRGIKVCEEWENSFPAFLRDMGPRPTPKHSIERDDNDGNYCAANCRWATQREQVLNTRKTVRIEFKGDVMPLVYVAESLGLKPNTLRQRIKRGWTMDQALTGTGRRKGVIQSRTGAIR